MNSFEFEYPYLFILLLLFIGCARFCRLKASTIALPHTFIYQQLGFFNSRVLVFFKWLAIIALVIAVASPIQKNSYENREDDGYNIVLLLDSSGSMGETHFDTLTSQTKFAMVQELVSEFAQKRVHDNLGVIVFGEYAYTASPLTYDKAMIQSIITRLDIGIAGRKTAINDAIAAGVKLLKDVKSKNRVMILLTDGVTTAGTVPFEVAIKLAKEHKVKVYTIGVGRSNEYDGYALSKIAKETKGQFFEANSRAVLKRVYEKIDELERSKVRSAIIVHKTYYYQYPLLLGIMSFIFFIYFRNKRGM